MQARGAGSRKDSKIAQWPLPLKGHWSGVDDASIPSDALLDSSIRTPGLVWAGIIDANGISGDGSAAIITFAVVGEAGSSTPLTLDSVVAYDASTLLDIITSASSGNFIVNDRSVTAPSLSFLP